YRAAGHSAADREYGRQTRLVSAGIRAAAYPPLLRSRATLLTGVVPRLNVTNPVHFRQQICHGWNVEIALQQGGLHAEQTIGLIQQLPHRIDNCSTMGINQQILGLIEMTRHVHIDNALAGHLLPEGSSVETEVDA